jgi:heme oxygenase
MLARLKDATRAHHARADTDRLAPLAATPSLATYISYLTRVYGFEAPIERELERARDVARWIDLRTRARADLIATDLRALGITTDGLSQLPTAKIPPLGQAAEALGWMYVLERNVLLNGILRRHLMRQMADRVVGASAYLASYEGLTGQRWRELGQALDELGRTPDDAARAIEAACDAFRVQHLWLRGLRSDP